MRKKSVKFVLMVNAVLEIKGDQAEVVVKNFKIKPSSVSLPIEAAPAKKEKPVRKKRGKSIHEIILESAKKVSKKVDKGIFSSVDLFNMAIKKYPGLNKKSFNTTIISAAPEHNSWKYYPSGRDYLVYLGKGRYKLREKAG
jgi:hypothetical protein